MSVYTKGGDTGMTDLFGMERVSKDNIKVRAYGSVDELSAAIGQARSLIGNKDDKLSLKWIQERIIPLCAELAGTNEAKRKIKNPISDEDTQRLEEWINDIDGIVPKFSSWIIPGDHKESAALHFARTVARRAEREIAALHKEEQQRNQVLKFVNRVSDYLFQLGRKTDMDLEVVMVKKAVERRVLKSQALLKAKEIADAAEEKAVEMGVPVTIVITDKSGHMILLRRMDGCLLGSLDIAQSKAKTAVMLRMTTEEVGVLSQPGQVLYGIDRSNGGLTPFGGGIPIERDGLLYGGIGVSGGSVEEDIEIAKAGLEKL